MSLLDCFYTSLLYLLFMTDIVDIKVSKKVADLLYTYCKFTNAKMLDVANSVFEDKFRGFKEKVLELSNFKVR